MNINEQPHKIQMEKDNKREKVMLPIKLIYKSEAHSYSNTLLQKSSLSHLDINGTSVDSRRENPYNLDRHVERI